jgi:ATPase subunit of ABC transporter with duplicated ATPase domains
MSLTDLLFGGRPRGGPPWANELRELLGIVIRNQRHIMNTLQETLEAVNGESDLISGVAALVTGLEGQLKDALAHVGLSAEDQAKVDAIFAAAQRNKAALAAALVTNVDPAALPEPTPTPAPVVEVPPA